MKKCIQTISVVCAFLCGLVLTAVTMLSRSTPEQFNVVAGDPLRLPGAIRVTDQKNATGQSVRASALSAGSTYQATLKLFGLFPLKDVKVKVVDQPLVIPCGVPFGIKMYTDGVLVVSMFAGMCGVLVHCYFENIFEVPYMMAYFWSMAAAVMYLGYFRKRKN